MVIRVNVRTQVEASAEHRVVPLVGLGCLQLVQWKVSFTVVEKSSKVDRRRYLPLRTNDSTGGHRRSCNVSVVTVFK